MKKLLLTLVVGVSLALFNNLAIAQHSHGMEKSDTLKAGKTSQMNMTIQSDMSQQHLQRRGRTVDDTSKTSKKMMGKKMMMQGHHKGMMGMMHGKMGSDMGMNDPIMMALHTAGCPGYLLKVADKLNLSDSQKENFEALKTNFKKFVVKKNADIKVAKIELDELLSKGKFDTKKIKEQIEKIESLQSELRSEMLKTIEKSRSFLRQDQLDKLKELRAQGGMGMGMMKHEKMK